MQVKKIMYLNSRSPYGTSYALESLESSLVASIFDQDVSLAFIADGVYQITKGQNTDNINVKNFTKTYNALADYGICKIYISQESLIERGLTKKDIIPLTHYNKQQLEKNSVIILKDADFAKVLATQDICLHC